MTVFQILAIAIITAFYAVYIGKQAALRKRGISGDRLARGVKPQAVRRLETLLLAVTLLMPVVQYGSIICNSRLIPVFIETPLFMQFAGAVVAFVGLLYFISAVSAMRDSWRAGIDSTQKTDMVVTGIYRFSRNPAFVGFDLMYAGVALMFPNALSIAGTLAGIVLFHLQILAEERYLSATFGAEYAKYREHTLRY